MKKHIPDMGDETSRVFAGQGVIETNKLHYGESAEFFAREIKKRLPPSSEPYVLADIGAFKGELLGEILHLLPEYTFNTIGVDINTDALDQNTVASSKVVCDATNLSLKNKSVDVVIMRYVLQWNNPADQVKILKEVARVIRKFAIIECTGPDDLHAELWRKNIDNLLNGEKVSKMKRNNYYFASESEIQDWLSKLDITHEKLRSRVIPDLSGVYIERYSLDNQEAEMAKELLRGTDYSNQSDWILIAST
jgi:ubiquinone/menaquinone biosynthesis C-methylase UbiE